MKLDYENYKDAVRAVSLPKGRSTLECSRLKYKEEYRHENGILDEVQVESGVA